jgi:hypothetical protein
MRQRLYEVPVANEYLPQSDIAAMVRTVFDDAALPVGVSYSAGAVPDLTLQAGVRLPQGETVGDFLDDLAALVGRFVVPPTQTYTYDSVVFSAGEVVPAVRWGVDANGVVFFRRPITAPVALDESDVNTRIDWQDISAEEVPNVIGLTYASAYDLNIVDRVFTLFTLAVPFPPPGFPDEFTNPQPSPYAMIRRLGSGLALPASEQRYKKVDIENPLDFCERFTDYENQTAINWSNPNNALDNNISTFTDATSGTNLLTYNIQSTVTGFKEGFVIIDYESTDDVVLAAFFTSTPIGSAVVIEPTVRLNIVLPSTGGLRGKVLLFLGVPATLPSSISNFISFRFDNAPSGTKLYRLNFFVPDVDLGGDLSERLARAYERQVQLTAGRVQVYDYLTPSAVAEVTAIGDPPVEVPIERVEYRLTTSEGLSTTFQLGAAYDAELEVERVLLERLARRAVREGGARR